MKLTVIGYWGAYPEKHEATSCYVLEQDDFRVVLDLGSGSLSRLFGYYSLDQLDALVLSHFHHDHIADVGSFQYAMLIQQQLKQSSSKFPIYAGTFDRRAFNQLTHNGTIGKAIQEGQDIRIGPFQFSFIKTKHPKPCLAMRITNGERTIVYTADTSYFDELVTFSKDADLLVAETSMYKGMEKNARDAGHMTSEEVGRLAQKANVKELLLTHLPHFGELDNLILEAKESYSGKVQLAKEGLTFNLYS